MRKDLHAPAQNLIKNLMMKHKFPFGACFSFWQLLLVPTREHPTFYSGKLKSLAGISCEMMSPFIRAKIRSGLCMISKT